MTDAQFYDLQRPGSRPLKTSVDAPGRSGPLARSHLDASPPSTYVRLEKVTLLSEWVVMA